MCVACRLLIRILKALFERPRSGNALVLRSSSDSSLGSGSSLGGGSGSDGGFGGVGGLARRSRGSLHGLAEPAQIDFSSLGLLLDGGHCVLNGDLVVLPVREELEDGGVLREPLDVTKQATKVCDFCDALVTTIFFDEYKGLRSFGELESSGFLREDSLHLVHGILVVDLAFLSVSEELLPLLDGV